MQNRAILAIAATVPLVAAQTVTITSKCSFPIYLWNVVNDYGAGPATTTLGPGESTSWSSPYESKTSGGGASIKLKPNNDIFDGGPLNQVEYKMVSGSPDIFYYDLSLINGDESIAWPMTMETSDSSCPTVSCPGGSVPCPNAYYHPNDLATLACDGTPDLNVVICPSGSSSGSSGSSSSSSSSSAAPPPAPTTSSSVAPAPKPTTTSVAPAPSKAAPTPASNNGGGFLEGESEDGVPMATVVATTVIPVYVTQHVPAATPKVGSDGTVEEDKREAHLHEHKHRGFSRVMGRHQHA